MNFDTEFNFASRRSPVVGGRGMVAASQPLAVAAGLEILRQGGNAADAAVAAAAALNVTEPTSTGIGGDCFALFYDAKTKKISALNGSGRAPAALSLELLQKQGFKDELPPFHAHTVTVPGAAAGWCDLVEQHGCLKMREILTPAIRLAEEGFPVAPLTSYFWQRGAANQLGKAANGRELTLDGRAPQPGERFHNPGLARTFRALAESGKEAFYQGEVAEALVQVVRDSGGVISVEDLAAHHSTWDDPISTTYRGFRVWECPPNGQGLAALLALNILEPLELCNLEPMGAERFHLLIEGMRLAFEDTRWFVADPATNPAPIDDLLSKEYASKRRELIDLKQANPSISHGAPTSSSDTVYLSVVDGEGSACSFINSNYYGFGTGIVPKGWGFTLQNRGFGFSLDPRHPNALAPGKRPYHTIIPALITREHDDSLFACYGVMGGFMQPQGHLQVAVALIDDGLDPQSALDRPRFCIENGTAAGAVAIEDGVPPSMLAALEGMGHRVKRITGMERALFGRGQVILRDPHSGTLWGGSDPRADGVAMAI